MVKDISNTEKLTILKKLLPAIVETVKKDLKNDHLCADKRFFKKYFSGKKRNKLTVDELVEAYVKEIINDDNEGLAEFVCYRWLIKNTAIYDYFAQHLKVINPQFDQIETIDDTQAQQWIEGAISEFGVVTTYVFSVLNSVVFSAEIFRQLAEQAEAAYRSSNDG